MKGSATFTDGLIFPVICIDDQDQVIASGIVVMEQIRHQTEQAQAASQDNQLIFDPELGEDILLVLLG